MLQFNGNLLSLPTPLTDDGRAVSEVRIARMMRALLELKVPGFQVCGAAGEFFSLTVEERKSMLEWTLREVQGLAPVVANVTSCSTFEAVDLTRHAGQSGARAVVVSAPFAGRYTAQEIAQHYKTVSNFSVVPVLIVGNRHLVDDHVYDALKETPHVAFVDGKSWDQWGNDAFSCNVSIAIAELTKTDRVIIDKLLSQHGMAPTVKGALEWMDIEVGALRAPKLRIPQTVLTQALNKVA